MRRKPTIHFASCRNSTAERIYKYLLKSDDKTLTAKINDNSPFKKESLSKIIEGLDHMSMGDIVENKMKSQMEWSLLPDKGIPSTVIPSLIFSSFLGFPKFPESYSRISRLMKINR